MRPVCLRNAAYRVAHAVCTSSRACKSITSCDLAAKDCKVYKLVSYSLLHCSCNRQKVDTRRVSKRSMLATVWTSPFYWKYPSQSEIERRREFETRTREWSSGVPSRDWNLERELETRTGDWSSRLDSRLELKTRTQDWTSRLELRTRISE